MNERSTPTTRGETWQLDAAQPALKAVLASEDTLSLQRDRTALALIVLPNATPELLGLQQRAESWLSESVTEAIDLQLRNERVAWTEGRAMVIAAPDRLADAVAGCVAFAHLERAIRKLSEAIDERLQRVDQDADLHHPFTSSDLARSAEIGNIVAWCSRARKSLVDIERGLSRGNTNMAAGARRWCSELALQYELSEKLRLLDDRLEVIEDLYESANERLGEYTHFLREYRLELLILAALVIEIVLSIADMLR